MLGYSKVLIIFLCSGLFPGGGQFEDLRYLVEAGIFHLSKANFFNISSNIPKTSFSDSLRPSADPKLANSVYCFSDFVGSSTWNYFISFSGSKKVGNLRY